MKNSFFHIIKSRLNKSQFSNFKNFTNKKNVLIIGLVFSILVISVHFYLPTFFEYNTSKKLLQNKIEKFFNLKTDIIGSTQYKIFPTPRIQVSDIILKFGKKENEKVKINELNILISPFKLKNISNLNFKKIIINEQKIQIFPESLKKYFKYFTSRRTNGLVLKNSEVFFIDNQNNKVIFNRTNLKEKFYAEKYEIKGDTRFSNNKIKIKFHNPYDAVKYLSVSVPNLNQSVDIKFDKESNLNNLAGELKLKIFESIFLINFEGKDDFTISRSYLRNKFINSKLDGKISFKNEFYFDLRMDINQLNLRKFFLFYSPFFQTGGLSKKINGKFEIFVKSSNSFFGKLKDVKTILILENGDIKFKNLTASLPDNTKLKSNLSIINNNKGAILNFYINFFTGNSLKFFRKFGLYDLNEKQTSVLLDGEIDINANKIILKKIIRNKQEKITKKQIKLIETSFNQSVLNEGIQGLFDFFKIKKFLQNIVN